MTTVRKLALKIVRLTIRFASPGTRDWSRAVAGEMEHIL